MTSSAESSDRWHERQAENVAEIQCDRDNPLIRVGTPRDILDILREGSDRKLYPNWHGICRAAADEIERLRKERDEARRSVCEMSIQFGGMFRRVGGKTVEVTTSQGCAEIMRWDCFKEARDANR